LPELVRWSYDLLDDFQRDVLQRAAVFVGGFDIHALSGVLGVDDDTPVLRALDRLVRSSLVVAEHSSGRVRYRLLETIRQFGIDELSVAGLVDHYGERHARWFASEIVSRWSDWNGPGWRQQSTGSGPSWPTSRRVPMGERAGDRDGRRHRRPRRADRHYGQPVRADQLGRACSTPLPQPTSPPSSAPVRLRVRLLRRSRRSRQPAEQAMALAAEPLYDPCDPGLSAFIAALANVYAGNLDRYVELARIADRCGGATLAFARPALVDGLQASGRVDEALALLDDAEAAAREAASPFWLAYALWIAGITLSNVDRNAVGMGRSDRVPVHGVDFSAASRP
jgi:hypothetical protein